MPRSHRAPSRAPLRAHAMPARAPAARRLRAPRALGALLPLAQPAARSACRYALCLSSCSARPRAHACPVPAARPLAQRPRLHAPAACALYCHYSDYIVAWLGTVLQYSPALPSPLSQYKILYCSPKISQPKPLSHNTSSVLQYTLCLAYPLHVAIQGTISQYNSLLAYTSCNTIWAVAKFHFLHKIFYFFFHIIYFYIFSIISRNWKKSLKSLKSYFFFTLSNTQINL